MCGIAGLRSFRGAPDLLLLQTMTDAIAHRGPDDQGSWRRDGVAFGHRRLSIIDLAGSLQPMHDVSGTCHVSFNGEIFNYEELRAELDYPFRTAGDTEVLLAAYRRWGAAHVRRLEGQFAYALFDERSGDLWLFRDRLGVLPLFYVERPGLFAFASEVKALLPVLGTDLAVDEDSLGDYLAHRSVPAPDTLFRGIKKLRPGHHLRVDASGRTEEVAYWQVPNDPPGPANPDEAVDAVDTALTRSVERALVADVPVGAYLSGGVDSSLITALMRKARPGASLLTFAAGFTDSADDERGFARQVATHVGTQHHEVIVSPADFEDLWPKLTFLRDAPLSEPADVAVYRLAQKAREHVKVVLSGEGSDELFGGYPKYAAARWLQPMLALPDKPRRVLTGAMERSLPASMSKLRIPLRTLGGATEAERVQGWFAPFTPQERAALLGSTRERAESHVTWGRAQGDVVQRMLFVDAHQWLSDNLLERGDRMSMAASLELRPPFLDRTLVELAFRLPTSVKLRHGDGKWVVKQVARRYLPASIVNRKKSGFRVPLDAWFRSSLRDMSHDLLLGPNSWIPDVLDRKAVRELVEVHDSGRRNEDIRLWTLLGLELWHRAFFSPGTTRALVP